jgi:hypothetical protein
VDRRMAARSPAVSLFIMSDSRLMFDAFRTPSWTAADGKRIQPAVPGVELKVGSF